MNSVPLDHDSTACAVSWADSHLLLCARFVNLHWLLGRRGACRRVCSVLSLPALRGWQVLLLPRRFLVGRRPLLPGHLARRLGQRLRNRLLLPSRLTLWLSGPLGTDTRRRWRYGYHIAYVVSSHWCCVHWSLNRLICRSPRRTILYLLLGHFDWVHLPRGASWWRNNLCRR